MLAIRPVPTRDDLVKAVEAAGAAHAAFFGYPLREDGLYLQQDPEEYAAFVHFMATKVPPADLTLEIGIASGGQTKFLRDYWEARKTIIVDIGRHEVFPQWQRIKQSVNSEIILEIIDNSHAPRVREKLLAYAGKIDFAFVDGDHSYRGLRKEHLPHQGNAEAGRHHGAARHGRHGRSQARA